MTVDTNTLAGRLKRYAQVSTHLTPLLAKLAGQHYLGLAANPTVDATALKDALGTLKGPLMKAAQIMATVPDMLPPEYRDELLTLQSQAPRMNPFFVRRRLRGELGEDWAGHFQEFNLEASFAASLGQVHQAVLTSGEVVACKLQYPDMAATVEADIQELEWVFSLYESFNKVILTDEVRLEIADRLREELDYLNEAKNMEAFRSILATEPDVMVPQVYDHLTTSRLLTMAWCPGDHLLSFKEASQNVRNTLGQRLFRLWYKPFYHHNLLHGDPHPGNYSVASDGTLVLYDYGCVRRFESSFVESVLALYEALKRQDQDAMVAAYTCWGFQHLSKDMIDILNLWAGYLYGPLLDDRVRPLDPHHSSREGQKIAAAVYAGLKRLGGVTPPREFVFMDRAAVGIGSVLMHLRAEANWHALFEEMIENK